jgi:polysaccharide export outer membrane protein
MACNPAKRLDHDFTYFQNGLNSIDKIKFTEPLIRPNDLLNIQVYSTTLNQEQAMVFNMANNGVPAIGGASQSQTAQNAAGILVNENGDIFYPYIGKLHVAGLTVLHLKDSLQQRLSDYVKAPEVLVRITNFKINVLGQVNQPGVKGFVNTRVTVLDAISAAGDLNDLGKRSDVLVLREVNGEIKHYNIDMRDAKLYNSPAFQLQQNDIVYVGPTENKLRVVKRNVNLDRDLSITTTFVSLLTLTVSLFFLFKK